MKDPLELELGVGSLLLHSTMIVPLHPVLYWPPRGEWHKLLVCRYYGTLGLMIIQATSLLFPVIALYVL